MLGRLMIDVTLDFDQSLSLGSLDSLDWTRLSYDPAGVTHDYPLAASYTYGRDRFIIGDFQTGLATIVLNNDTGEFSPNSGVNAIGGNKLAPGQLIRISYGFRHSDTDEILETLTGDSTWETSSSIYGPTRPIVDAETATGFVDGRTWTANVNTPGDIDLTVPTQPPNFPPGDVLTGYWVRWMGRIWSITDRYDPGGRGAVTVLECADLMADLAQYNPGPLSSPRPAEDTGAAGRWGFIWLSALNDGNMVGTSDAGIYDIESTDLPSNYLEEARVAARAEGGAIYADHGLNAGAVRFRDANWLLEDPRSATVQHTIGNTRIGISAATTDYSAGRVFNDLHYSNSSTTVDVSDATSIAAYSTRSLIKTVLNNDNTDLDTIADRDLALLKDAKLVITSVEIRPRNLFEELMVVNTTIGDLIDVTIENNGWSYTQQLHVSGVSETWDARSGEWICTLRLDSRDGDTVIS